MNAFLLLHANIMMTLSDFSILLLALIPAICSSCTKPEAEETDCLCIIKGIEESKSDSEKQLHIFLFDDDSLKRLDSYQLCRNKSGISISSRTGNKILCAVWAKDFEPGGIEGYEGLCGKQFRLMDDDAADPIKTGELWVDMGTQKSVTVNMEAVISSVLLKKIRCDFTGKPYENQTVSSVRAYLTNVNGQCNVMGSRGHYTEIILNSGQYSAEDDEECNGMLSSEPIGEVGKEWKTVSGTMYCYSNTAEQEGPGTPFTRLVIEGEIEGEKYWWPIDINRKDFGWEAGTEGIAANGFYSFSLTIKGLGSKDPDTPVSPCEVEITPEIVPWVVMDSVTEEY